VELGRSCPAVDGAWTLLTPDQNLTITSDGVDVPLDFVNPRRNSSVDFDNYPMSVSSAEPLRGTVDLLLLRALALGPMHGWGITQRIQAVTSGVLEVNQGSLYPALLRLEQKEWIDSEWRVTDNNRRAKFYRLTPAGRKALGVETASWRRLVVAVEQLLSAT